MYHSHSARVRAFFVASAAAFALAACSGGGQSTLPSTGGSLGSAGHSLGSMAGPGHTPTPAPTATPAPTSTPISNPDYKIITGLQMDASGNFTEPRTECTSHASKFESETGASLPVAALTQLPVCTSDNDDHHDRGGDLGRMSRPGITPTPSPTPVPTATPTPGVATDLVIISVERRDGSNGGFERGIVPGSDATVLTGVANLYNGTWSFSSLGNPNTIVAEHHYFFFVAEPVAPQQCGDGHHGDRHGDRHDGHHDGGCGGGDHHDR